MEREEVIEAVKNFHCPQYAQLPALGLYLEQMLTFVNRALAPVLSEPLTGAMISNYVKNGVLPPPVKKRYGQEHLVYLIVTSLLKQVFTIHQIARFFEIQRDTYPLDVAYDYFCAEYENAIDATFNFTGEAMPRLETQLTDQTILLRACVLAAANRIYAEKVFF